MYQNAQQYGNIPANRLASVMHAYRGSLGVGCDHCHLADDWASDEKPAKQMARRMFDIRVGMQNDFFEGKQVLSCWTCHRGEARAQTNPPPEMLPPRGNWWSIVTDYTPAPFGLRRHGAICARCPMAGIDVVVAPCS